MYLIFFIMKTYKIKLSEGEWVEGFQPIAVCVTNDEHRAGRYQKSIAIKRLKDRGIINYTLELINV
jgi:hypothetical protein